MAALALRIYLVPIFWMAGQNKLMHFSDTVEWFANPDLGLGLPFPTLMAVLATSAELGGAILLALGLFTRLISIPLIITMLVAILTVHLPNGWQAIADAHAPFANAQVFMLREMIELSSDEICEKLQLTISHLNVLMYRSRARLRECLENKWLLQEDCSC
jgi:uncharacterized membrane protein YphA (DoxX/SURF4 family)